MMDESIGPAFLGLVIALCQTPQRTSDKKPTSVSFANELKLHVTRNWPIYESLGPGPGTGLASATCCPHSSAH